MAARKRSPRTVTKTPSTPTLWARYVGLDAALVAAGFPPTSPWWLATLERFYSGTHRQLVLRVGRRGGKSSTLCRVAVVEALYGDHVIPPGDVGIVGIVSVSRDEAAGRLRTVRAILDALGIRYRERDQTIELVDRPIVFRVFTASVAGVVGGTWITAICDEVALWRDVDTGANPANEVLASLRPTMATMSSARLFLSSSPLGSLDAHAVAFDAGETDFQQVGFAETWIANPTISEAQTHALELNQRHWSRQFAAVPQGNVSSVFDLALIDAAMSRVLPPTFERLEPVLVFDASRGGDAWTWLVACWCTDGEGHNVIEVCAIGEVPYEDTNAAVVYLLQIAKHVRIKTIVADQYEQGALQALFRPHGYKLREVVWTQPSKVRAVDRFERWLRDRTVILPKHPKLRRQLSEYSERVTNAGMLTYSGRGVHDDYAAVCVSLAMADIERFLPGSPAYTKRSLIITWGDDEPQQIPHSFVTADMQVQKIVPKQNGPSKLRGYD